MSEAIKSQARIVYEFNALYPVGTPVDYFSCLADMRQGQFAMRTKTRQPAQVLSGHTAVVWIEGKGGAVALSHVRPVPQADAGAEGL